MAEAYRAAVPRCPLCSTPLETAEAGNAEIDVCPTCNGIWFDWFDGELTSLARLTPPAAYTEPPIAKGSGGCPRCDAPLETDTVEGIEVQRCGACAGAFVSRAAANELANVAPKSATEPDDRHALARVGAWLRDLFFGNPPSTHAT